MTKHAILTPSYLYTNDTRWEIIEDTALLTLDDLCTIAEAQGLSHLWVMPQCGIVTNKDYFNAALQEWNLIGAWDLDSDMERNARRPAQLITATGWRRTHGNKISVCWPEKGAWSWFYDEIQPVEMLDTISYMEAGLKVEMGNSPASAGMRYLKGFLSDKIIYDGQKQKRIQHEWLAAPTVDLSKLPFEKAAFDVIWDRPLTASERGKKYLHKYDKNGAYLRSCVEEMMGAGDPQELTGARYDDRFPGIWKIMLRGEKTHRRELPPPIWEGAEWLATPVVKMLRKLGYELSIERGCAWPEKCYHGTLKNWAEGLWDARQRLRNNPQDFTNEQAWINAAYGIKQIATATIGLAGSGKIKEERSFKYRPDWKKQVVGGVRATMMYNMVKFSENGDYPPIVYMDALYYASDDPNPETAIPYIMRNKTSLGGYKHVYTVPLAGRAEQIIHDLAGSTNTMLEQLNDLAEELEEART